MRRGIPYRRGIAASFVLLIGVPAAVAGGLPTTSTTTTSSTLTTTSHKGSTTTSTTTLPPGLRCENGVETALARLASRLADCSLTAARRQLKGKPSHEDACRAKARARYVRRASALGQCPACLEVSRLALADEAVALADAARTAAFCGNPPADRAALRCGTRALRIGTSYLEKLLACRVEAARQAFRGEAVAEDACRLASRPGSPQLRRLRNCPCIESKALLDALLVGSRSVDGHVYCPCIYGQASACDDGEACTTDACDASAGCMHTAAADMTPCASDGSSCTADVCRTGACQHEVRADGSVCDDSDKCNVGTCLVGACLKTATVCNDHNPCTDDSCNAATGCVFTNNAADCTDGKVCTAHDRCDKGMCVGGDPLQCDDGDPTTCDECVEPIGCVHTPCS